MYTKKTALFFLIFCISICFGQEGIPEHIKKEYALNLNKGFEVQSYGESTQATYYFERGYEAAKKAGEPVAKLEAIRQLFVWYRTYGYYLGLMRKDPKIFGQYIGSGRYSTETYFPRRIMHSYGKNPEKDAKSRDFVLGVSEILSGILCFWLVPPPYKIPLGAYLVEQGFNRAWDASNALMLQRDISIMELQKTGNNLKTVAK